MNDSLQIRLAGIEDINTIGFLAHQIWPVAYKDFLSFQQLQYMLNQFYSPSALRRQIQNEHQQFLLAELDDEEEPLGFASFSAMSAPFRYKLNKLYIKTHIQNKGVGKALLEAVIAYVKAANGQWLQLNVNRENKARYFYEKQGFTIIGEEDIDIGNSYFMNDFVMERKL